MKFKSDKKKNTEGLFVALTILVFAAVVLIIVNVELFYLRGGVNNKPDVEKVAKECWYLDEEDEMSTAECLESKAWMFFEEGDCDSALRVYDYIPTDQYDDYSLSDRYAEAYSLSLSCDEEKQEYWKNKFEELSNKLEAKD